MLHSAQCIVHVGSTPSRGYYTDNDYVTGTIEVDAKREIRIASIEAQLRCEERARTFLRDNEDVVDLTVSHGDDMEVLWSSELVTFDISQFNGELPKGQHQFPFTFKLPESARGLPSSYNAEPPHDYNGIFWGVHATIDRETRLRTNYRTFGEIPVLPHRCRAFSGTDESFRTTTKKSYVRQYRRPSFLLGENSKHLVEIEGRLSVPSDGLTQTREPVNKDTTELPDIRVALRVLSDEAQIIVKEIIVFIDTTVMTRAGEKEGMSQSFAIVIAKECRELITETRNGEWQDLSHLISTARIYGLPETWKSKLHEIDHKIRVQLITAPENKPNCTSILEMSTPVILHSEATTTADEPHPPPPYDPSARSSTAASEATSISTS